MDLQPNGETRTEELERALFGSLECVLEAVLAVHESGCHTSAPVAAWLRKYEQRPPVWQRVLGQAAVRRILAARKGGA